MIRDKIIQDKTGQDKIIQDKTRQDKTRQDKCKSDDMTIRLRFIDLVYRLDALFQRAHLGIAARKCIEG